MRALGSDVASIPELDALARAAGFRMGPFELMDLIGLDVNLATSDDAIERAYAFVERIGKTAALAADTPGFIVNRVARPYYLQSMRALGSDVASIPELDALARAAGFRMGPFELMDLIGLDVNLATSESVYERTDAARLIPVEMQREMVRQGRLGRKSGIGFYDYTNGAPDRLDLAVELPQGEPNDEEFVAVLGFGGLADEIAELDSLLGPETVFLVDAYATGLSTCAARLKHPERVVGFGILGSFESQRAVEIVDSELVSDDALALVQELFESIGKGVVLVEDVPGLFLGRVVGSIVNEAVIAVHEDVADADDIDVAMRLGTNYPIGPIAWGREIGGARVTRILQRVADAEGEAFAPHRSLWVLDVEEEGEAEPVVTQSSTDTASILWGG
jgi:3-hydroxybutyryl-CoA dehydrogenase